MALLGEVTIKVIRAILLAKEFTVSQIADITGIKHDSAETVIQRLLKDGLLVRSSKGAVLLKPESEIKKGRPKQFYKIAENDKLRILQERADAFLLEHSIAEPRKNRPSNPHFLKALSIIEAIESGKLNSTDQLLNEASNNLILARDYEGMVDETSDVPLAYIDFVEARLQYLSGDTEDSEELLIKAKDIFRNYNLPEEHTVDDYVLSTKLKQALQEANKSISNNAYELLGEQLKRLADDFSAFSNLPSITSSIKEFIRISSHVCSLTAEYMTEKTGLEKQLHSLLAENQLLKFQQKISLEINANLSETVKNISVVANHTPYYQRQTIPAIPESSFIGEGKLPSRENVISITEKMRNKISITEKMRDKRKAGHE